MTNRVGHVGDWEGLGTFRWDSGSDPERVYCRINTTALPQYDTKTVAAQSATITKVSGATLTWSAYRTSLQSALTQAGL